MIINQTLAWAKSKLIKKSLSANLDAEILLLYILNYVVTRRGVFSLLEKKSSKYNKTFLYTHPEYKLTSSQLSKFKKLIKRRAQGEPIAYLIGHKEFYGLDFIINKHVLVPRPETELLVKEVLKQTKSQKLNSKGQMSLIDIGTGSGCIAITLAKHNPQLKIYASDISNPALTVAKKNNQLHHTQIIFKKGNLLEPFKNIKLDVIVANLPYLDNHLKKDILDHNESIGLKFEPTLALYAGKDGLDDYRQLIQQIKNLKYQPQFIYLEIGHHQANLIKKIISTTFTSAKISIKKDLAGLNRLVIVKLN